MDFDFNRWLVAEMERQGITAQQMAKATGVSVVCIRHYIRDERLPRWDCFQRIVDYLGKRIVIADR